MTHIIDDVEFIKRRMEELARERAGLPPIPGSEQGVKIPAAEQRTSGTEPAHPSFYSYY